MSRANFAHILEHVEDALDSERRRFLSGMQRAITDELDDEPMTAHQYVRLRQHLDDLLNIYYGRIPNDPYARFMRLILAETDYAIEYAIAREQARFVRFVEEHVDVNLGLVEDRL
jgi:hypothetical protein